MDNMNDFLEQFRKNKICKEEVNQMNNAYKFNIGDKVKIKDETLIAYFHSIEGIIKYICETTDGDIYYLLNNHDVAIHERDLELIKEIENKEESKTVKEAILEQLIIKYTTELKNKVTACMEDELNFAHEENRLNNNDKYLQHYNTISLSKNTLKEMPIEEFNDLSIQKLKEIVNNDHIVDSFIRHIGHK